jgi:hypothetical protein
MRFDRDRSLNALSFAVDEGEWAGQGLKRTTKERLSLSAEDKTSR